MSNIFSRFLAQFRGDESFHHFVSRWDRLERLILTIYRKQAVSQAEQEEWQAIREWLIREYPQWQDALHRIWPTTLVAGNPAEEDPFLVLLSTPKAQAFIDNWAALQYLPAARESINRYLQAESE